MKLEFETMGELVDHLAQGGDILLDGGSIGWDDHPVPNANVRKYSLHEFVATVTDGVILRPQFLTGGRVADREHPAAATIHQQMDGCKASLKGD